MKRLSLSRVDLLANFFEEIEIGMKRSIRWKKYYQHGLFRKQTSWDHAGSDINLLTLLVAQHIGQFYPQLDVHALLATATTHDLGEAMLEAGDIGDVLWTLKQHDNSHQRIEWNVFKRHFRHFADDQTIFLSHVAPFYLLQYDGELDDLLKDDKEIWELAYSDTSKSLEKRLFNAIEKLLYVIDAAREYHRQPRKRLPIYINVLRQQHDDLFRAAQNIKGFSFFYSSDDEQLVVDFLELHKDKDADKIIAAL